MRRTAEDLGGARALAVAPQVLLLDEPLSGLDAQVRVQLREEIRRASGARSPVLSRGRVRSCARSRWW